MEDKGDLHKRMMEESLKNTPRHQRATVFANTVLGIMRDFLPANRRVLRHVYDHLMEVGFINNSQIISVPPECDEFDKLRLERAMYERHATLAGVDLNDPFAGLLPRQSP
jgi:hypothetical protein